MPACACRRALSGSEFVVTPPRSRGVPKQRKAVVSSALAMSWGRGIRRGKPLLAEGAVTALAEKLAR